MCQNKTQATKASVESFLDKVESEEKRKDAYSLLEIMHRITAEEAVMWGPSIVGFGTYHYKYESGREGDCFIVGFSPRKVAITIYIMPGFERHHQLMAKLGKFKTGKACLYIKKLRDVDMTILEELIKSSYQYMVNKYHA